MQLRELKQKQKFLTPKTKEWEHAFGNIFHTYVRTTKQVLQLRIAYYFKQ